jgi:hypothetical protein
MARRARHLIDNEPVVKTTGYTETETGLDWYMLRRAVYVAHTLGGTYHIIADGDYWQCRSELHFIIRDKLGHVIRNSERIIAVGRIRWLMRMAELHAIRL